MGSAPNRGEELAAGGQVRQDLPCGRGRASYCCGMWTRVELVVEGGRTLVSKTGGECLRATGLSAIGVKYRSAGAPRVGSVRHPSKTRVSNFTKAKLKR